MSLNDAQLEAINCIDGNIAVIATAGSGKTTVLTRRIENMVNNNNVKPDSILAVTFSKKAKESISDKLNKLGIIGINVETFHSLALKIIIHTYGRSAYTVWNLQWEKEKCITDICTSLKLCKKDDVPYNEICKFISRQKVNMKTESNLIYCNDDPFSEYSMKLIYENYEEFKKRKKYIEFDDFLNMANDAIDTYYDVHQFFKSKFQYILSDEFQDISMSQSLLLKKLNDKNTMIVGDPLQAIYSFRGGKSEYILNFDKEYENARIINLNTNYRCSNDIVQTANSLAATIPDSKSKYYMKSIALKDNIKKPIYNIFSDEYEEAEWIANKVKELSIKYSYHDFAILARTNAQLAKVEAIFHKNGIPSNIVDGKGLMELPEINLLLSYLKLSLYENDNQSFEYLYNKPNRWLDKQFLQEVKNNSVKRNISYYNAMMTIDRRNWRFKNGIDEIYEVINYLQNKRFNKIGDMIKYLRVRLNIDNFVSKGKISDDGSSDEQIENMNAFENIANQYSSLDEFLKYVEDFSKNEKLLYKDKVNLSTIHRSKGLEYPVVFIIGCNDGILPHEKNENIDDEKRLFYVAITRAEDELYISSTTSYNSKIYYPSNFISSIEKTIQKQ